MSARRAKTKTPISNLVFSPTEKAKYEKLKEIRASKTFRLHPTPLLREQIVVNGETVPFRFRYYQFIGAFHLIYMDRMLLGDGTGLGKCLTGDTLLTTDRGLMPIQELAPLGKLVDDTFYEPRVPVEVWTGHETTPVRRFYWNGTASTLKLMTRNGFHVEGSLAHPVRVRDADGESFKRLPSVETISDYVCIDRSKAPFPEIEPTIQVRGGIHHNAKKFTYPPYLTPNLARLLGYVVAEAWTNGRYATNISQHANVNPETHADIRKLLLDVFGWEGNDGCANQNILISVNSIGIRKYLEACGVTYTTARFKEVPWCILQGSEHSVREFLRGLFEGEGSVSNGGVEFSSSSEKLIRVVQVLLLRFGIISTLAPKHVEGFDHTYWRLTFFGEDARTFAEDIGFVSSRKDDALKASLKVDLNPNKDVVPYMGLTVAALKDMILRASSKTGSNDERCGSGLKQYGESFQSTLKHVIHGKRNATYRFLRQLLEISSSLDLNEHPAFKDIENVVRSHFFYDPVVSIEEGRAPLMDIEVEHDDHCFSGNGIINHNTVELLGSLAYIWSKQPEAKTIVVTPKSATLQWASEVERFLNGVRPIVAVGKPEERKRAYEEFVKAPVGEGHPKVILILNYKTLVRDWDVDGFRPVNEKGKPDPKQPVVPGLLDRVTSNAAKELFVVFDECAAFKNPRTKTWQVAKFLSEKSTRCYGLTATLLKNHLIEGFAIYKVIVPRLFTNITAFMDNFCTTREQRVPGTSKYIRIITGYVELAKFRALIDPFFIGRPKHAVSDELPKLVTKEIPCEMTPAEISKYDEALTGVLALGDGEIKDYTETKQMASLIYCQEIVNSLHLLKFNEGDETWDGVAVSTMSSKEQELLDLLQGELEDEKVIIYSRFEKYITRLSALLKEAGIKSGRITGKEKEKARDDAKNAFQDLNSDTNVIFISDAGSEAINLQSASAMVFMDAPWSYGNYIQLLGRPIRIGSIRKTVVVYHLIAFRPSKSVKNRRTIDHHVLEMLHSKKDLVDQVLGESAVGALDFEKEKSGASELLDRMRKDFDVRVTGRAKAEPRQDSNDLTSEDLEELV